MDQKYIKVKNTILQCLKSLFPHQNDGNTYMMGVDDFILPSGHKLYFSEYIRGLYVCGNVPKLVIE